MQQKASKDALKQLGSVPPSIWRRVLCSHLLPQLDVMTLGECCHFLRQDHALGLHTWNISGHFKGEDTGDSTQVCLKPRAMPHAFRRLLYKFRYAETLQAKHRAMRLHDSDFEELKISQLRRLDLSFCRNISAEKLLNALKRTLCLRDLCLRGCSQLSSPGFEEALESMKSLTSLATRLKTLKELDLPQVA